MKKENKKYIIKYSYGRCCGKTLQRAMQRAMQDARDYYYKNESSMTEERKIKFKEIFEETWGERL